MSFLGMLFVGSLIGLSGYYLCDDRVKLRLRTCLLVSGFSTLIAGYTAQIAFSLQEGSMYSFLVILLSGSLSVITYIYSQSR